MLYYDSFPFETSRRRVSLRFKEFRTESRHASTFDQLIECWLSLKSKELSSVLPSFSVDMTASVDTLPGRRRLLRITFQERKRRSKKSRRGVGGGGGGQFTVGLIGNESWQLTSDGNGCRQRFPRLARTSRIYVVRTTSITGFPNPPTTFFIFRKERETLVNTREVNRSEIK